MNCQPFVSTIVNDQAMGGGGVDEADELPPLLGAVAPGAWAQSIKIPDLREPPASSASGPGMPCDDCGVIRSIREVHQWRKAEVPGAFRSDPARGGVGERNLVGGVAVLPLGGGRSDQSFVGGVGTPELQERFTETTYEITVRLDNGGYRLIERRDGMQFQVGDRVRLSEGRVERLAN